MGIQLKKITFSLSKILLFTYIITGVSLFILAFLMYKMDLGEGQVNIGIIIITILSTFIGGILAAKTFMQKRFIYGAIVGALYFIILFLVSFFIQGSFKLINEGITMFFMCVGGGTLGGMFG